MSDVRLRELERAWQTDREDERALDRFLDEARRHGLDPVERLGQAGGDEPWAGLLRASIPIVRTQPIGETFGRRLLLFVKNGDHFLAHVDVFADGAIDAWGLVDRALFARKLTGDHAPPVATTAEAGERVSIHDLGKADVAKATWLTTPGDVERAVDMIVRVLARPGTKLVDLDGDDTEVGEDDVRRTKLGFSDAHPYRRGGNGALLRGAEMPVFVRTGKRKAELAWWVVYEDGQSHLAPYGSVVPFDAISKRAYAGEVTTRLAGGDTLVLPGLGSLRLSRATWYVDRLERIREAADELEGARGKPTAVRRCADAFGEYGRISGALGKRATVKQRRELDSARERLREAYEAVPEHNRKYVSLEGWIRQILYPDEA
jgi:hypothetical protein